MAEPTATMEPLVTRMALREARGLLTPASLALCVRVVPVLVHCPWCGARERDGWPLPLRGWEPGWDWAPESAGRPTLRMLACEAVTARSLLPLALAVHREPALRDAVFRTRAVTWLDTAPPSAAIDDRLLTRVDEAESWWDAARFAPGVPSADLALPDPDVSASPPAPHPDPSASPHTPHPDPSAGPHTHAPAPPARHPDPSAGLTLPCATRLVRGPGDGRPPCAHFLTPHGRDDARNTAYLATRLDAVAKALAHPGTPDRSGVE